MLYEIAALFRLLMNDLICEKSAFYLWAQWRARKEECAKSMASFIVCWTHNTCVDEYFSIKK